jgi:hypothetical protein
MTESPIILGDRRQVNEGAVLSSPAMSAAERPLEVRRQKNDRLAGGKLSCAVVFDRAFTAEEIGRFYLLSTSDEPSPLAFSFEGRVVRYICPEDDEARWRLALEIYLVKIFRQTAEVAKPHPPGSRDARTRLGLRKLHLG